MAHRSMLQGRGSGRGGLAELRATQKLGREGGLNWDGTEGLWRLFPEKVTASDHGDRVEPSQIWTPSCLLPEPGVGRPALTVLSAPPGLAVDYHNERLYWADAKLSVIGSIRLNGTDPIVAADSKRGQPPPAVLQPCPQASALPSGPKASPSTRHPPHLALSIPAVPFGSLPTRHPQHQSCRPDRKSVV